MAYDDGEGNWTDEERYYSSGRSSDDSPILYRNKRAPSGVRRSALTLLAKFFLFSMAMILFCVLMYIPVYRRVRHNSRATVAGWSIDANRDTKVYIRPNNITVLHNPKNICQKDGKRLFLLIVVTSAAGHTNIRNIIRNTYANYNKYLKLSKIFHDVTESHKNCNFTYDDEKQTFVVANKNDCGRNEKTPEPTKEIRGFKDLLPEIEKSLRDKLKNFKTSAKVEQSTKKSLEPFDMNKEIGEDTTFIYDNYDYDTNVMKIPADGEDEEKDVKVSKILNVLSQVYNKGTENDNNISIENPDFKIVFLVGRPINNNSKAVDMIQEKINSEIKLYDDVIQEDFIDTYNNLTLKSIMMLKWVINNCHNAVRYVLKADDDIYLHVPHLIDILRNESRVFDKKYANSNTKEYLLLGYLMSGAKPVQDVRNKWYSPKYMYSGRVYPNYLSGVGYVMSYDVIESLYKAALEISLFHLEDIFITGMSSVSARPPPRPRHHPALVFSAASPCAAHAQVPTILRNGTSAQSIQRALMDPLLVSSCEKLRLIRAKERQRKLMLKMKKQKRHR